MRNIRLINTLIAVSMLTAGSMAYAATTPGGTVQFRGEIVNAACAVSANSDGQAVNLGQSRTAAFSKVGDRSGPVSFTIELLDCDTTVSTKVSVSFTGAADAVDKTILAASNAGGGTSGAATGVGIEISDAKGTVLSPDGATFSTPQTLNDGKNVLNFNARYKSTLITVTAGRADADALFTMKYE